MRQAHDCTKSIDLALPFQPKEPGHPQFRAVLEAVKTKPPTAVAFGQS